MIDSIGEFVARRFRGVGRTAGSFVRIHLWAIAFLVVISLLLPSLSGTVLKENGLPNRVPAFGSAAATIVQRLTLDGNDPRAFRPNTFGKQRFRIAWITGSEGAVYASTRNRQGTYLAALAAKALPRIDNRRVAVDLYALPGIRLGDIYFALLDAIRSKPDMIVVTLNPVWVLDPVATHQWAQLDAKAADILAGRPAEWPVAAAMLSPEDLVWGVAGAHLKAVEDRASYSNDLQNFVKDLGPLDRTRLAADSAAQPTDPGQALLTQPTVRFWFRYRLHEPRGSGPDLWAKWISESSKGRSSLNDVLLKAIGRELRGSHIPSYVYLAQINSGWLATSSAIQSAIGNVERQLVAMKGSFASKNVLYQPLTASRFVRGLGFLAGDPVHLESAAAMGPYLGAQLCALAQQTRHQAKCSEPKGNARNG